MSDPHNPPPSPRVERPRREPEIIPPGAQARSDGVYRVHMVNPPFGIVLVLAVIALASVAIILLVIGALIVWIPIIAFVVSAVLLMVYARHYWFRARNWMKRR